MPSYWQSFVQGQSVILHNTQTIRILARLIYANQGDLVLSLAVTLFLNTQPPKGNKDKKIKMPADSRNSSRVQKFKKDSLSILIRTNANWPPLHLPSLTNTSLSKSSILACSFCLIFRQLFQFIIDSERLPKINSCPLKISQFRHDAATGYVHILVELNPDLILLLHSILSK